MVRACRMGTPLLIKVPRVRVNLEMATLLTTGPMTGILSLNLSQAWRPNLVRMNKLNTIRNDTTMARVIRILSFTMPLMPSTRRVNAGRERPSIMPSNTALNEGTTFTIRMIRIAVATTRTAQRSEEHTFELQP